MTCSEIKVHRGGEVWREIDVCGSDLPCAFAHPRTEMGRLMATVIWDGEEGGRHVRRYAVTMKVEPGSQHRAAPVRSSPKTLPEQLVTGTPDTDTKTGKTGDR